LENRNLKPGKSSSGQGHFLRLGKKKKQTERWKNKEWRRCRGERGRYRDEKGRKRHRQPAVERLTGFSKNQGTPKRKKKYEVIEENSERTNAICWRAKSIASSYSRCYRGEQPDRLS